MLSYRATPCANPLLFLRARAGAPVEVARAWCALSPRAETIDVDGDHHAIVRREHAPAIADQIASRLQPATGADRWPVCYERTPMP
jgi:hypothetical protein